MNRSENYEPVADHAVIQDLNASLIEAVGVGARASVVDLGCGTGSVSRTLLGRNFEGLELCAVDPDAEMIDVVARSLGGKVRTVRASAEELTTHVPIGSVDAVIFANAIHLVPDIEKALAQIHEVLRPGGRLAFSTAFFEGSDRPEDRKLYWKLVLRAQRYARERWPDVRHEIGRRPLAKRAFSPEGYREMLSRVGLTEVHTELRTVELDHDLLLKVLSAPLFAAGGLPGLDPSKAAEAVQAAAQSMLREAAISLKRDWLFVVATKAEELN